ncbi:type VI secretion system-associated protein TagF [Alloalcanivorax xenomutans]|jgi:type VI secretion system protein ImpM|uniref:Type VI secretion system-associated protein TagF n=1 Tax=Alloalcanivorax xenomutans TaxID=1094342 RepID=A0A9Q3ZHN6_9GAMM|nr:type VI secretion system-associated protein TagF [Alloalcanivorax xenomutans]ARB45786.1 type VI secretion protein [Alloalcanivorax xenomutans]MCE7509222.1 type VI secretion system-associated protein TagF [Alloalcanivorax xenomutans]MCE7523798.1 type VI secretion system-associated protein TagF [Alloalcanivorax xenomutans]SOB97510.1 type VI secretion system protein ImpM [Alloalcanivorax xenomutans]
MSDTAETQTVQAGYFGKLPSRGDFVRSSDQHRLMSLLDRWAAGSLDQFSHNPDWKTLYDQAPWLHFAFLGSRSQLAIAGHMLPSSDASQRRYPFLSALRLQVADTAGFIARSPLALFPVWRELAKESSRAVHSMDAAAELAELGQRDFAVEIQPQVFEGRFQQLLEQETLAGLEQSMRRAGHPAVALKRSLPALGLLLQPLMSQQQVSIDKGLILPLPAEAEAQALTATWWLDMLTGFVRRGDFELAVLIRGGEVPALIVGFNGADHQILRSVWDPNVAESHLIAVQDADWVEDYMAMNVSLNRLASYIDRGDLSLASARRFFMETFLGGGV